MHPVDIVVRVRNNIVGLGGGTAGRIGDASPGVGRQVDVPRAARLASSEGDISPYFAVHLLERRVDHRQMAIPQFGLRYRRLEGLHFPSLRDPEGEPDVEEEPEDPGLQKRPRDLDLPPWLKGRYGTAVGRAVHGVLQAVDLATGEGLDAAVASQCEAEAVVGRADEVRRLVTSALGSQSVRAAAAGDHWKELYVCAPLGDRQLEGYIDLLYRGPDGLVVVDYKTSATSDPADLAGRVDGYRVQGASYARVVGTTTGEPVTKVTFVFLTPDGAIELDLPDLGPAMEEIDELVG